MIYQALHFLFGWDYILWRNNADQGIARIHREPGTERIWYWRYKNTTLSDFISDPTHVLWLTCPPSKYFPESGK